MSSISLEREELSFNDEIGKEYIRLRRVSLKTGTSKSIAISYAIKYLSETKIKRPLHVADFGCFDGEFLSQFKNMSGIDKESRLYGFDYNESLLDLGRKNIPGIEYYKKDLFTDSFNEYKDLFDIGFCVNTLHEIYSFHSKNGVFNHKKGINSVMKSIENMTSTIKDGGILIIFDGVASIHRDKMVTIGIKSEKDLKLFNKFFNEYQFNKIDYKQVDKFTFSMKYSTFTKFITKYRFLDNIVWQIESEECYQYFTPYEFKDALKKVGLQTYEMSLLSPNTGKWSKIVDIIGEKFNFPDEHILIIGKK